jgi:hypothetical protein
MTTLPQLRTDLAAARITLRQAKDELETAKAKIEELEKREQTEYVRLCIAGWKYHIGIVERRED